MNDPIFIRFFNLSDEEEPNRVTRTYGPYTDPPSMVYNEMYVDDGRCIAFCRTDAMWTLMDDDTVGPFTDVSIQYGVNT